MNHLNATMMMKNLSKTGVALLLLSLGTACSAVDATGDGDEALGSDSTGLKKASSTPPVNLGKAGGFAILAKSGISVRR